MSHAPALHRTFLHRLEFEARIGEEDAESEIDGRQVSQEFGFIIRAGRGVLRGRSR